MIALSIISDCYTQSIHYEIEDYTTNDGLLDNSITQFAISPEGDVYAFNRRQILQYVNGQFLEVLNLQGLPRINKTFIDTNGILWLVFLYYDDRSNDGKFVLLDTNKNFEKIDKSTYIDNLSILNNETIFKSFIDVDGTPYFLTFKGELYQVNISVTTSIDLYKDSIEILQNSFIRPTRKAYTTARDLYRDNLKDLVKEDPIFEVGDDEEPWYLDPRTEGKYIMKDHSLIRLFGYFGLEANVKSSVDEDIFFSAEEILVYDIKSQKFKVLTDDFPEYFINRRIFTIEKQNDTYWIGTNRGIIKIVKRSSPFDSYFIDRNLSIREMMEIDTNSIIAASESGLYHLNLTTGKETLLRPTYHYGIEKLDDESFAIFHWQPNMLIWNTSKPLDFDNTISIPSPKNAKRLIINGAKISNEKMILCGNYGISLYDKTNGLNQTIENAENLVRVTTDCDTMLNRIFCYSSTGILEVDTLELKSKRSTYFEPINDYVISSTTLSLQGDYIWLCTKGNGLIKWEISTGNYRAYNFKDGLLSNNVHSATYDNIGRLWLSTDTGISVLDAEADEIVTLMSESGIHETEMNRNSYLELSNGKLLYGTINGIIQFDPNSVKIKLSELIPSNSSLEYRNDESNKLEVIRYDSIPSAISLSRSYQEPEFVLDYENVRRNSQIRYRFQESSDAKWFRTENGSIPLADAQMNDVLYISYKLNLQKWSESIPIKIKTLIPFYKQTRFYLGLLLLAIMMTISWLILQSRKDRVMNKRIQEKVDLQTIELSEKVHQLSTANALNQKLFSTIGHDLRSPILSLHDLNENYRYLLESGQHEELEELGVAIEANSTNVINVIDRLLDWSRSLKNGDIMPEHVNLKHLVDEIIIEFSSQTKRKDIEINNHITNSSVKTDKEGLRIILRNLIHNGIKFSLESSSIDISNSQKDTTTILQIKDQGIGMNQSQIAQINSKQNTISREGTNGEKGIGLGLETCRVISNKIGARISAKQNLKGSGVTFYIHITMTT